MTKQKKLSILFVLNPILILFLYFLEIIRYPGIFKNYLNIDILYIALLSIGIQAVLLFMSRKVGFFKNLVLYFIEAAVIFSLIASLVYSFELSSYPNAVFNILHIHPLGIRDITLYFWMNLLLLIIPQLYYVNKKVLAVTPVLFLIFLAFLEITSLTVFISIGSENGLIEWSSFIFFVLSSIAFLILAIQSIKINKLYSFIFLLIGFVLFFMAGEEVSWGKWIFEYTTPEYFAENNLQQETTIHNLRPFHDIMWIAYVTIGFIGGIIPFFKKRLVSIHSFFEIIPPTYITTYFLPLLLYGLYRTLIGPIHYKTWEESIELIFSVGMIFHARYLYKQCIHTKI